MTIPLLADLLELAAKRLRAEGADALLHAEEWKGAGYPNRSPGVEAPVKTGSVSDPTRDAAHRTWARGERLPEGTERVLEAARRLPKLLPALEAAADHTLKALDALKVVPPTESLCSQCGMPCERPHFHDGERFCQVCHDKGDWRRVQKREWMRGYRSEAS